MNPGARPVAELRPAPRGLRGAEFLARYSSLPHLTPAEAAAMEADIEGARRELDGIPVDSPWDS